MSAIANRVLSAALAAGLSACLAGAARADVVYTFEQTGPTVSAGSFYGADGPVPNVVTSGSFTLDQSIVRSPFGIYAYNQALPSATFYEGLEAISFATTGPAPRPLTADLRNFTTPAPGNNGLYYMIRLAGLAGSLIPVGEIYYNDQGSDARLIIEADTDRDGVALVRGTFNTDAGGPCFSSGACSFSGTLTATMVPNGPVPVPEPASAALFGLALLGLGLGLARGRR